MSNSVTSFPLNAVLDENLTPVGLQTPSGAQKLFNPPAVSLSASKTLTIADNGSTIECQTTLTLTVPAGLPVGFGCAVLVASGTVSVASSGGALLNGATSTLTRLVDDNPIFGIIGRSTADSYRVTGS